MNLKALAEDLDRTLALNRRPNITDENVLDTQAMCVAEEAGELVGAYRRWRGRARRLGTKEDLEHEIADVLIVTAVFARRAGIDIDQAVFDKLEIIYNRGWQDDGN